MQKNIAWGRPHIFPTQYRIFSFFSSPQKNFYPFPEILMPPHAIQHIAIHPHAPFCMRICGNLQFTSNICSSHAKIQHELIPTQTAVTGTHPHTKFCPFVGL